MSENLLADFYQSSELHRERLALVYGSQRITFGKLAEKAKLLASALSRLSFKNRLVSMLLPTGPELALTYFAAFEAGLIAVPLNYAFRYLELSTVLNNCSPDVLIVHSNFVGELAKIPEPVIGGIKHRFLCGPGPAVNGFRSFEELFIPGGSLQACGEAGVIFHTSGTTGKPKGVVHTLESASFFTYGYKRLYRGEENPITIIARNCYHSGGFYHLTGALSCATTCVLQDQRTGFDASEYIRSVESFRASQLFLSVAMLNAVLDSPSLSSRMFDYACFVSAGADEVKQSHHERLANYTDLPLTVRYSSTECQRSRKSVEI